MATVLTISQGAGFMINSIKNILKKKGIDMMHCEPNVRDFESNIMNADAVLLMGGEYLDNSAGFLSYVSVKCTEECVFFCVAGYPEELDKINRSVDPTTIYARFRRPFDMAEFVDRIKEILDGDSSKNTFEQEEENVSEEKHHIMMCDDDVMFLKMVQDWLSEKYRVSIVKSGMLAIPFAINNSPELILLDYEMPVMPGPKVLEALREDKATASIPVVFLSGHSDTDSVLDAMRLKPQGYLLKTAKKEEIISAVDYFFKNGHWKVTK